MKNPYSGDQRPGKKNASPLTALVPTTTPPAFGCHGDLTLRDLRRAFTEARQAWLVKSPSTDTRENYARDLDQFLRFLGINNQHLEQLAKVVPGQVAAWRDHLQAQGLTNNSVRRKMTALRSLYSYLQTYGYAGANPAHGDFVDAPSVPPDGKTVALSAHDCRRLLQVPDPRTPIGIRDRAMLAVLAYTGCRVGELCRLRAMDYKTNGGHKILEIRGKGGKERRIPLHPEAFEVEATRKRPCFDQRAPPEEKGGTASYLGPLPAGPFNSSSHDTFAFLASMERSPFIPSELPR